MPNSSQRARWSIILITIIMNAALVVTSVAGFFSARTNSSQTASVAAQVVLHAVKMNFRHSSLRPDQVFESAIQEMEGQGLKFLGVYDVFWNNVYSAGTKLDDVTPMDRRVVRSKPVTHAINNPWSVRVTARVPVCMGRGGNRCWVSDIHSTHKGQRFFLVADIESNSAKEIMSRAVVTLVVSLTASLILLVAAGVFFRLSRRADRIESQLAEDRHLKSLGQMSAVLGHELRNPIASLKGHAQLLEKKCGEDHPGRGSVETVIREAERLEVLTDQVLDFARTGKLDLAEAAPVEIVKSAIEKSGADPVVINENGDRQTYRLDAPKMEQVLVNLLYNARQSSPPGEQIQVELARDNASLVISVIDAGQGIIPGDEERIFEPFFTKKTRGTGLGLPLAKRIVEGHGGRIEAANHVDGGAVFRIEIPR